MQPAPHPARGEVAEAFRPVAAAFGRLVGRRPGAGGGALVVRMGGETVANLWAGSADRRGERPWTPETLAISFSTTKGVASTVVHRLADRGLLGLDDPVAAHWPAFGAGGKERITVRDVMTHRAGLHSVQAIADRAEDVLDHLAMEERIAARAVRAPTRTSAYHAFTYGWVLAGLLRGVTGRGIADLVRTELAEPLGVDGLHVGVPPAERGRVAEPVGSALRHLGSAAQVLTPLWTRATRMRAAFEALHLPGFDRLFLGAEPPIWSTEMAAINGAFSADALARLYATLANGGADGGTRLLSAEATHDLGRVRVRTADAVLGLRMRWRTGYHQAFVAGRQSPRAFGHYGYGGSGAWADPKLGLSVGFVTNRIGSFSTPLGDVTLMRLSRAVRDCALRAAGRAPAPA
ncbi:MAG TPA: serine hydrolase domain-containing protein [Solirubrobacteraceae bacterium]|jgi:CubicO group peptidase (beta-lactamase class C family)|nr:serine hydrolase domain-containing protein [Solirubrobacteraceae bacterium]